MGTLRFVRTASAAVILGLFPLLAGSGSAAGQQADDPEARAKRMRQGAGLRAGPWWVQDLPEVSGAEYSRTPSFEGYFQKGLDLHLALESTLGFWRRTQEIESTGPFGGTSREEVQSYVVPTFTSIKLYPLTRPSARVEPWMSGGIGLAVGIDDRTTSGDNLLGLGVGSGTVLLTGFGFQAGAGLDGRLGPAFGLTAAGRYRWLRFSEELGGERTYRGFAFEAGLTYRFQYE